MVFQSTFPRGERQNRIGKPMTPLFVSIHAPAGGATFNAAAAGEGEAVSIHAPARGATAVDKGRDGHQRVSIHAPTGGSDLTLATIAACAFMFQSTLPRRERPLWNMAYDLLYLFQSTLPQRERPGAKSVYNSNGSFNPRSHGGSDAQRDSAKSLGRVSIHAPTEGATPPLSSPKSSTAFQSTLPRRERLRL